MSPIRHESAFGDATVASFLASGWTLGSPADHDQAFGLDTGRIDVSTAGGRGLEE